MIDDNCDGIGDDDNDDDDGSDDNVLMSDTGIR